MMHSWVGLSAEQLGGCTLAYVYVCKWVRMRPCVYVYVCVCACVCVRGQGGEGGREGVGVGVYIIQCTEVGCMVRTPSLQRVLPLPGLLQWHHLQLLLCLVLALLSKFPSVITVEVQ